MTTSGKQQHVVQALVGFEPEIGRAVWMLENARDETKFELRDFNPAYVDLTIVEDGHSIGTLLYHIAIIEFDWLFYEVLEEKQFKEIWDIFPHPVRDKTGQLTRVTGLTWEAHWERLDKVRACIYEVFKNMTLEDYRLPRICEDYDVTPEWVLHHLRQHEAEHRSEIIALVEYASKQT